MSGFNSSASNVVILGTRGIPAAHGGFETLAERLALYLVDRCWNVTVYCQGSFSGKRHEDKWHGITRIYLPVKTRGALGTLEFDVRCVADAAERPGTILTLGYNTGFLSLWLRLCGRANHVNMDGIEWLRAKYGFAARLYLRVNERLAAWNATTMIADHPEIERRMRRIAPRARVTMLPYGGDQAGDDDRLAQAATLNSMGLQPDHYFSIVARPEPDNSILELVSAFSRKEVGVKLAIAGDYCKDIPYQGRVIDAASKDVVFLGPIYDRNQLRALRQHSLAYLHGHTVGGTNPSLVEALSAGNAIIALDNPFNRWVAHDAALYFRTLDECLFAMNRIRTDGVLRKRLRSNARARANQFAWEDILAGYARLLSGDVLPETPPF